MKQSIFFATLLIIFSSVTNSVSAQVYLWARSFADIGAAVIIDASGNVYTTGYFSGTVDFDPGVGTANLTASGSVDAFVQKMSASGNFVWAKSFGGTGADLGYSISIDASGNLYTIGSFEGTVDFDPGAATAILTSAGAEDVFVQKIDSAGNFLWARSFAGSSLAIGVSINVDASGNVYSTGYFGGTVDFDPGVGTANLTATGSVDVFVQKMNASGNYVWAKSFGGAEADIGNYTTIDASGNLYTTGLFVGSVDFDPGGGTTTLTSVGAHDIFVQKMDASGNFVWAKSFGDTASDVGASIIVDATGNVYTTGYFSGKVDFDPGAGTTYLTSTGVEDVFVQRMDSSGNFIWAKSFGSTAWDKGASIKLDAAGNIYTAGFFAGTADFDPGPGTANLTCIGEDVFIQKMDASGNFAWVKSFTGGVNDRATSIIIDASGNLYTTGYFAGTVDFDPGIGTAALTAAAGSTDAFVHKMGLNTNSLPLIESGIIIAAYPNPGDGLVRISFEKPLNNVEIIVTDSKGQVCFSKKLESATNEQININGTSGIYYIIIVTANGRTSLKLIKE